MSFPDPDTDPDVDIIEITDDDDDELDETQPLDGATCSRHVARSLWIAKGRWQIGWHENRPRGL